MRCVRRRVRSVCSGVWRGSRVRKVRVSVRGECSGRGSEVDTVARVVRVHEWWHRRGLRETYSRGARECRSRETWTVIVISRNEWARRVRRRREARSTRMRWGATRLVARRRTEARRVSETLAIIAANRLRILHLTIRRWTMKGLIGRHEPHRRT